MAFKRFRTYYKPSNFESTRPRRRRSMGSGDECTGLNDKVIRTGWVALCGR